MQEFIQLKFLFIDEDKHYHKLTFDSIDGKNTEVIEYSGDKQLLKDKWNTIKKEIEFFLDY
jgi:hypothetical protein